MPTRSRARVLQAYDGHVAPAYRSDDERGSPELDARVVLAAAEVLTAERERVIKDTYDEVLDELLAASLSLSTVVQQAEPTLRLTLDDAVHALDRAVALLRSALISPPPTERARIRPSRVLADIAGAAARALGFAPHLHLTESVDSIDDARLLGHLALTVRQLLTDIARSGSATSVEVVVAVDTRHVEVTVSDDGPSAPRPSAADLAMRARDLGGAFEVTAHEGQHTTVARWSVPR